MTPPQVRDLIERVRRDPDDFEESVARLDSFLRGVIVGASDLSSDDGGEQWYRHVRSPATVDALCDGALRVCDGLWSEVTP